jgi:hypothetical protein
MLTAAVYHLYYPQKCTLEDLWLANKKGFDVAQYWAKYL